MKNAAFVLGFVAACFSPAMASAQDKPVVDLRDRQGVPRDLKENDPKPKPLVIKEPPAPETPKPRNQKPPKSVGSVRG